MNANLRNFALWVIIVLLLLTLFTVFQSPVQRAAFQEITYSQLLGEADRRRVREVVIDGPDISGTFTDGRNFKTVAPNDPTLAQRLHANGVSITARPPPPDKIQWLTSLLLSWLPFIALAAVWIFLSRYMRRTGRVFGFGQGAAISDKVLGDPKYWRDRADEMRAQAGLLNDHDSKRRMVEIIQGYEYLAQRAEDRRRGSEKST